jgi:hypothetical protein
VQRGEAAAHHVVEEPPEEGVEEAAFPAAEAAVGLLLEAVEDPGADLRPGVVAV